MTLLLRERFILSSQQQMGRQERKRGCCAIVINTNDHIVRDGSENEFKPVQPRRETRSLIETQEVAIALESGETAPRHQRTTTNMRQSRVLGFKWGPHKGALFINIYAPTLKNWAVLFPPL